MGVGVKPLTMRAGAWGLVTVKSLTVRAGAWGL